MKYFVLSVSAIILLFQVSLTAQTAVPSAPSSPASTEQFGSDPDLPPFMQGNIDKGEYLRLRSEHIGRLRGMPYPEANNPRIRALQQLNRQLKSESKSTMSIQSSTWTPLGPAPIPHGQTENSSSAVSGRVTAIAIHPTHPDTVYVGTAQGGVYRTFNGGSTWTPIFDNASSLAVGAITIDPMNNTTLFVGTGEGNLSLDSFFGVGLYIIKNAETSANLFGPYNLDGTSNNVLAYRSITNVLVDPSDDNTIFIATTSGVSGTSGDVYPNRPARGVFRSTNAMSGSPTFTRLDMGAGSNTIITDAVLDPGNPNNLVCAIYGQTSFGSIGGIYRTANALAATPTFSQTLSLADGLNVKFGINKTGSTVTVYAATAESDGMLRQSTDGGQTWSAQLNAANAFCYPQCWYDIAIAVDPLNANVVYICGSASGYGGGASELKKSTDGGSTFSDSYSGLHADMHAIAIAPSPGNNIIFVGNDGGVFRSTNSAGTWTSANTTGFNATQFESIALHPTNRNFTIGGTQDNGTNYLSPSGTWMESIGGDGGFSLIDQNATDTTNVTMYHTFYNGAVGSSSQIGFQVATTTNNWGSFYGCLGSTSNNGIGCSDNVLFYAPMALGPGNPNTVYFGTDRLYRSADRGTTMAIASQAPLSSGTPISAIGISPQDDNTRIVGLSDGHVFATTFGINSLTDITGSIPAYYVARAVIDPNNSNTAYVTLDGYGTVVTPLKHIWKTTSLLSGTWTAVSNGMPDVPVNAFVVDPMNSNELYCGTDIGVFHSSDGGAIWNPYGTGLPFVAVFDMAIQNPNRILRIATHGRGMWEIPTSYQGGPVNPGSVVFSLSGTWNLISIPVAVSNDTVKALFPNRSSNAFTYNGSSYVIKNQMNVGTGYWLKFSSPATDTVTGSPLSSDSIAVNTGWNLIGSLGLPLLTSSITSNPPGMITSKFFGYSGNYKTSDTINPGKGYWVKVNQPGTLILSTGSSASLSKNFSAGYINIVPTGELPPSPPSINETTVELPKDYALEQNYPNPFNPTTILSYALPEDSRVRLTVFNLLGQVVATLTDGIVSAGYQTATWNANLVASGVYFYRLEATSISNPNKSFTQIRKMALVR